MSADFPNISLPPPKNPQNSIDPAEFLAVRTIVMSLVAIMAGEFQRLSDKSAQLFINGLAAASADAIMGADISCTDGLDTEGIRRKTLEQVNHILGGVRFPRNGDKTN